ncbi:hypothetical protein BDW42DRAFT_122852 [Aspergillus taichungensis]|uniref:Uncharacterized protein n=1 Tax=Aspergillus taichungensis TaxID=482145 RepID=A0A2J5HQZ5_9EURO|nr:hypothetical protein BDW42DRAFT_122852 [Aspergillus taichungensis]
MSRPMLSSAVRRLSQPRPVCTAATTSRAPGRPVSCFSASFGNNASSRRSYSMRMNSKNSITARRHVLPPSTVFRQCRGFSASSVRPATKVAMNPRKDDDGNTLMIDISERATEVR